jgi:hypothetical protein
MVAIRIAAIGTQLGIADVVALRANAQVVFYVREGRGERSRLIARRAQYIKREPLGLFLPDAGQPAELVNQTLQRRGKVRHERLKKTGRQP